MWINKKKLNKLFADRMTECLARHYEKDHCIYDLTYQRGTCSYMRSKTKIPEIINLILTHLGLEVAPGGTEYIPANLQSRTKKGKDDNV